MDFAYLEAGMRAQEAGYDAMFINSVADYGLHLLRESAGIPVIGAGQAAMQLAAGLGARFAILTVWPAAARSLYERLLSDYGLRERCMAVRHVTDNAELAGVIGEDGLVAEMHAGRQEVIDRIAVEGERLVDEGAEAIVLGCGCMSPIYDDLVSRLNVPVIDSIRAGHKLAETMVAMDLRQAPPVIPPVSIDYIRHMVRETAHVAADLKLTADSCGDTCSIVGTAVREAIEPRSGSVPATV
ncbi:aspartate/glutamate racemase family protein [Streptomyces malaysiensis]|uniref:aspartate/glutamate racemase family protein n=1 Tax=Streptomyces malaysiensis TaxID=92644 RepID=UPI002B29F9BC|nr:aspartate/glutamate racemase family protein [Streptomyces malaysiensis]